MKNAPSTANAGSSDARVPSCRTKRVALLGSTGSVGTQALEVINSCPSELSAVSLAARRYREKILPQVLAHHPRRVALADDLEAAILRRDLQGKLGNNAPDVVGGPQALDGLAADPEADIVLNAISGASGLSVTRAAVRAGKVIALANKESLVAAGEYLLRLSAEMGASFIPVDSEHSAIHQALRCGRRAEVSRIILTASGGPFLDVPESTLQSVSPEEALRHPRWDMGPRISIDSATLMNKALEIVEAMWLFDLEASQISVVIHPQSIVHSLVEFTDGSVVAQLAVPDMRIPIRYALGYPNRLEDPARVGFRPSAFDGLRFREPDERCRRSLDLGYRAATARGTLGAVMNAANEVAVEAFLSGKIPFTRIVEVVENVMRRFQPEPESDLDVVVAADAAARVAANHLL